MSFKFTPNQKGFNDMRNMSGVQKACLNIARNVAAIASGATGKPFECDVQPGKTRCHARASCYTHMNLTQGEFYNGGYGELAQAASDAAVSVGGKGSFKGGKRKKRR